MLKREDGVREEGRRGWQEGEGSRRERKRIVEVSDRKERGRKGYSRNSNREGEVMGGRGATGTGRRGRGERRVVRKQRGDGRERPRGMNDREGKYKKVERKR